MAGDASQGHQEGVLNLKLGHPPVHLASIAILPSLSTDFQPLGPFPSIFLLTLTLTHSRHHALRSPRSGSRQTLSSSAANPSTSRPASFSLQTQSSLDNHPHTPQALLVTLGPNLVPQLRTPRGHLTARPAPQLHVRPAAPARSHCHGAQSVPQAGSCLVG